MNNIFTTIKDFEGIIGTLLGMIIGWILSFLSKNIGHVYFYLTDIKVSFTKQDELGGFEPCDLNSAQYAKFEFEMDVYNDFDIPKSFREFNVVFYQNNQILLKKIPKDSSTIKHTQYFTIYDDLLVFNIQPKTMCRLSIHVGFGAHETVLIKKLTKIIITCKNYKNKTKIICSLPYAQVIKKNKI